VISGAQPGPVPADRGGQPSSPCNVTGGPAAALDGMRADGQQAVRLLLPAPFAATTNVTRSLRPSSNWSKDSTPYQTATLSARAESRDSARWAAAGGGNRMQPANCD